MKKYSYLVLLLPIIVVFFSGCKEEPEDQIHSALLPYVERFVFEANERDYDITLESITIDVQFENLSDPSVIGRCQRNENGENLGIAVDQIYWKMATELEKEYVMFHELGHCVLNRPHTTESDGNNTCLSIMEPGTGELCTSNYNDFSRASLLDELFDF